MSKIKLFCLSFLNISGLLTCADNGSPDQTGRMHRDWERRHQEWNREYAPRMVCERNCPHLIQKWREENGTKSINWFVMGIECLRGRVEKLGDEREEEGQLSQPLQKNAK